jgi:hypothetical protein
MNGLLERTKMAEAGLQTPGRAQLLRHLAGETLTARQAVLAKCADCTAGYQDGKQDCRMPHCPLYSFAPYREVKAERVKKASARKGVPLTPEQKAKMQAGRVAKRASAA